MSLMPRKKKFSLKFNAICALWVLVESLLFAQVLWARAGGGGGGRGGGGGGYSGGSFGGSGMGYSGGGIGYAVGGGGGSSGGSLFVAIVVLVVLIYVVYQVRNSLGNGDAESLFPDRSRDQLTGPTAEVNLPEGEDVATLKRKVSLAFVTIQQAWSDQRLQTMRRFITDGVYQRFNAQFAMMKVLGQRNPISELQVNRLTVSRFARDGGYDCVELRIDAEATDQFTCEKYPSLNSPGGHEAFTEYWTFIRRTDYKRGSDIFHAELCPKCSTPLTAQLLETARCPSCGTVINSGEYDWVLSKITQSDDYGRSVVAEVRRELGMGTPLNVVENADPSFATAVVEDKASNVFMQILIGQVRQDLNALKRFTTPDFYAQIQAALPKQPVVFDRLYTRDVKLIATHLEGDHLVADVGVSYTYQQIDLKTAGRMFQTVETGEESLVTNSQVISMLRILTGREQKGSIYAGSCANCGAPMKDSLSATCTYCGAVYNDPRNDWVASGVVSLADYHRSAMLKKESP